MNNNIKILQAMLLMAETLNYSATYKEGLIIEIKQLIKNENDGKQYTIWLNTIKEFRQKN